MVALENEQNQYADLLAERGVIAGIYKYGIDAYHDISDIITSHTFTLDTNQIIFKCFQHVFDRNNASEVDISLILSAADSLGCLDFFNNVTEQKYLRAISNIDVQLSNVRQFAIRIREYQIRRQAIDILDSTLQEVKEAPNETSLLELTQIIEKPITEFSNLLVGDHTAQPLSDGVDDYLDYLEQNRGIAGLSSGYPKYDWAIGGGFRRKTVNVICSRAKIGKSSISINVSDFQCENNVPVLVVDTEMGLTDHWSRLIAKKTGISISDIETGTYRDTVGNSEKIKDTIKYIKSIPYHFISVAGLSFTEIMSQMRRWILKTVGKDENNNRKNCLIIYDYIKLTTSTDVSSHMSEHQAVGFLMSALHNFAVKYDVPVLAFTQLNRDAISKETTDIISQSDRILWLCSNLSIFKTKSDEEIAQDGPHNGNRKLVTLAARHGPGMPDREYLNFDFRGNICDIRELSFRSEVYAEKRAVNELKDDDFKLDEI
jgi:replicative DNA helicase